jgi:hypothetical protein
VRPAGRARVSGSLTVVLGWLDRAKSQMPSGEAHDAIDVALSHARLGHTIARRAIGAEVQEGNVTRSALSVARDSMLGVAQEAAQRGVSVVCDDESINDLLVRAAPVAQQILINLLLNAVHFSSAGGVVELVLIASDHQMRFQVRDAGPGIAPERIELLFKSADSTRPGGAGIGLRQLMPSRRNTTAVFLLYTGPTAAPSSSRGRSAKQRRPPSAPSRQSSTGYGYSFEDDPAVQTLVDLGPTRATVATASTIHSSPPSSVAASSTSPSSTYRPRGKPGRDRRTSSSVKRPARRHQRLRRSDGRTQHHLVGPQALRNRRARPSAGIARPSLSPAPRLARPSLRPAPPARPRPPFAAVPTADRTAPVSS